MKKEKLDIEEFGVFCRGLETSEIKEYLKKRAGVTKIGNLYNQFCKIAGVNTVAGIVTPCCKKAISLMYRYDVERFADVLFEGKKTYFD